MKDVAYYRKREQTYLKHFFLEKYLERVARVIGWSYPGFVYVDGFSGPWKSEDERFEDTSFMIALTQLRRVRDDLRAKGKAPNIRCLFIEKSPKSFAALQKAVSKVTDLPIEVLNGDFEDVIPQVLEFIDRDFSLTFIDPTGWTGFALQKIAPILQHKPGEVLINFMFDYVNRFLKPDITPESFNELMGGPGWGQAVDASSRREETIIEFYEGRLRGAGSFQHITHTRILKPISDRAYFYLVYGTGHVRGLQEFRGVEKKCVGEQESVRASAKQQYRVTRSGQSELFSADALQTGPASYDDEKRTQLDRATSLLRTFIRERGRVRFQESLGALLELPLVWEDDIQSIIKQLQAEGEIAVEGMIPRQRIVKSGNYLVAKSKG